MTVHHGLLRWVYKSCTCYGSVSRTFGVFFARSYTK